MFSTVRHFGPVPWGPDLEAYSPVAPLGQRCVWCQEKVKAHEFGVVMPCVSAEGTTKEAAYHRECYLRQVFGSVGHQRKRCSCYGGSEEDPVELSKREAARAAVQMYLLTT